MEEVPKAQVRVNDMPAIAGGALLGLDYLSLKSDAEQMLRTALRGANSAAHLASQRRRRCGSAGEAQATSVLRAE